MANCKYFNILNMPKKRLKKDKEVNAEEKVLDQEKVDELSREDQLEQEVAELKDKQIRLFAEFENYKKRTAKERIDLFRNAGVEFFEVMLPILDDFDRATKHREEARDIHELQKAYNEILKIRDFSGTDGVSNFGAYSLTQIPGDPDSIKGHKARGVFWTKPDGSGKEVIRDEKINEAKDAGADMFGNNDLIESIQSNKFNFDILTLFASLLIFSIKT